MVAIGNKLVEDLVTKRTSSTVVAGHTLLVGAVASLVVGASLVVAWEYLGPWLDTQVLQLVAAKHFAFRRSYS